MFTTESTKITKIREKGTGNISRRDAETQRKKGAEVSCDGVGAVVAALAGAAPGTHPDFIKLLEDGRDHAGVVGDDAGFKVAAILQRPWLHQPHGPLLSIKHAIKAGSRSRESYIIFTSHTPATYVPSKVCPISIMRPVAASMIRSGVRKCSFRSILPSPSRSSTV